MLRLWPAAARGRLLVGAGLASWVGVLFTDAVLGRGVLFERDIHGYWHPLIAVFRRIVQGGAWPLWNPDAAFGAPFLADPNLQLAYPPTWAALLIAPAAYYTLFAVMHCLFTGWGAYRLGRAWRLGRLPAALAAAAWCASGPFLSTVSLFHHYAGAAWMPWVLWAWERALAVPGPRAIAVLGLAAAGQLLAGSGEMVAFTWLAASGCALWFLTRGGFSRARAGQVLKAGGLGVGLALLLAAVQWVPAAALLRSSTRATQDLRSITFWSVHPASLADAVIPNLVSRFPWAQAPRQELFEGREPLLRCLYVGLGMASLAVLGLLKEGAARPRLLAVLAGGFGLAALGRFTPFGYVLALPPLSAFRYPVKYTVPAALFVALLAGSGAQAWLEDWTPAFGRRVRLLLIVLTAFGLGCAAAAAWIGRAPAAVVALADADGEGLILGLVGAAQALLRAAEVAVVVLLLLWQRGRRPRAPSWLTAMLLAAVGLDLALVSRTVNPLAPASLLNARPPVVEDLAPGERVYAVPHPLPPLDARLAHPPPGWEPAWSRALASRQRLTAPTAALWGLRGSYDGVFTGLAPPWLGHLSATAYAYLREPAGIRLLQLGAVRHVVATRDEPGLRLLGTYPSVLAAPIRLYEVPEPMPSAYWVGRAHVMSEPVSYALIADPRFAFREEVVLAAPPPQTGGGSRGAATPLEARADRLSFRTSADGPGFLVVVEAYDPGWRATVDGQPAQVLRANVLFRAVPVPGGEHRVELRYRPPSVAWGLGLTGVGLLAAGVAWTAGRGAASIVGKRPRG